MSRCAAAAGLLAALLAAGCGKGSPTAPGGPGTAPPPAAAADPLKGKWKVVGIVAAGNPVPDDRVAGLGLRYEFDGKTATSRRPDRPGNSGPYTLSAGTPPRVEMRLGDPPVKAVYAVEGDRLKLALMVDDRQFAEFPAAVASSAAPKVDLLTLERE